MKLENLDPLLNWDKIQPERKHINKKCYEITQITEVKTVVRVLADNEDQAEDLVSDFTKLTPILEKIDSINSNYPDDAIVHYATDDWTTTRHTIEIGEISEDDFDENEPSFYDGQDYNN